MTFPWDELNIIRSRIEGLEIADTAEQGGKKYDTEKVIDIVYEYLEMAWTMGVENTNENLSTSFAPQSAEMRAEINRKIAGKDYKERLTEYAEKGDFNAIMRVAETESHRLLNEAAIETARKAGAQFKTWITMQDPLVRDTHDYLLAVTVPIDDYFVTYNGDRAQAPGQFGIPEEDCNCRCVLTFA